MRFELSRVCINAKHTRLQFRIPQKAAAQPVPRRRDPPSPSDLDVVVEAQGTVAVVLEHGESALRREILVPQTLFDSR